MDSTLEETDKSEPGPRETESREGPTMKSLKRLCFDVLGFLSFVGFFWMVFFAVIIAYDVTLWGLLLIGLAVLCLFSMDYFMDKSIAIRRDSQ